jgi:hypothetical protein
LPPQLGSLRITSAKIANAIVQFAALDHIPFAPRLSESLQLDQQPAAAAAATVPQLSKSGKVALTNVLNSLTAACVAPSALGKRKRTASAAAAP